MLILDSNPQVGLKVANWSTKMLGFEKVYASNSSEKYFKKKI